MIRLYIIVLLLVFWSGPIIHINAQDVQLYGGIPGILLKSDINDQLAYSLNFSSEINFISRMVGDQSFPAEILNLNLEGALSYDYDPNLNLTAGLLYRLRNPFTGAAFELRPWQQLTTLSRLEKYRVRNRFRAEQRWVESSDGTYDFDLRLRYRLSADFPLQGLRLDDKEFYLNLSSEVLITATAAQPLYFWENRNYLGIGYRINSRNRIEPALDFRTRKRNLEGDQRSTLFLRLLWVTEVGKTR